MEKKTTNKYWQEVYEMEELSIKIEFYKMLSTNINNEEWEDRKKAEKFYNENKNKHVNKQFEKYLQTIDKAHSQIVKYKDERKEHSTVNIAVDRYSDLEEKIKEVKNYFLLFQKYRQNLELSSKDTIFLDIITTNKSIVYKNETKLLEIAVGLVSNYFEIQAIKLIQKCMLSHFKVSYKVKFPTKPFRDLINTYSKFVELQGYKLNFEKELEFPTDEMNKFIENEVDSLENPQMQINNVIEHHNASIGIEAINEE